MAQGAVPCTTLTEYVLTLGLPFAEPGAAIGDLGAVGGDGQVDRERRHPEGWGDRRRRPRLDDGHRVLDDAHARHGPEV